MVWYPCLSREESRKLPDELKKIAPNNYLHAELHVHTPRSDGFGMHGSGMFVINPPYMLTEQLQNNLPELSKFWRKMSARIMYWKAKRNKRSRLNAYPSASILPPYPFRRP